MWYDHTRLNPETVKSNSSLFMKNKCLNGNSTTEYFSILLEIYILTLLENIILGVEISSDLFENPSNLF